MTAKKPKREARRNVSTPELLTILVAARRDYERAKDRYESLSAVLTSHTLWEHEDGRDLCDFDGQPYPCSTVSGLGFVFDVKVDDPWKDA